MVSINFNSSEKILELYLIKFPRHHNKVILTNQSCSYNSGQHDFISALHLLSMLPCDSLEGDNVSQGQKMSY